MIFRQFFEPVSSTYTYLLGCEDTRLAVLIDPVLERADHDLAAIHDLGLTLTCTLETHVHADHVTSAARLKSLTGCRTACPAMEQLPDADVAVSEVEPLDVGHLRVQPLYTPGHTATHHSYLVEASDAGRVFTGDALLIDGCGRTDFQDGNSETLFASVRGKLFALPGETLVYPGHDYQSRHVSSIAQERARNPRLGEDKSLEEFVSIMANLNLPRPKLIDVAVPANRRCGRMEVPA